MRIESHRLVTISLRNRNQPTFVEKREETCSNFGVDLDRSRKGGKLDETVVVNLVNRIEIKVDDLSSDYDTGISSTLVGKVRVRAHLVLVSVQRR